MSLSVVDLNVYFPSPGLLFELRPEYRELYLAYLRGIDHLILAKRIVLQLVAHKATRPVILRGSSRILLDVHCGLTLLILGVDALELREN